MKSSLIQAGIDLLRCQRYLELNPVRARMVDNPAHGRWNSYRANGLGQADHLLTPHSLYGDMWHTTPPRFARTFSSPVTGR
ncbi:MAG TPA: hypothetical protein PKZ67_03560 [Accumulibacter sp.]|uniref:Transposase n=1 Tax=Candidatus Accumulibacter cognatus TaxID=2954383 RepID=A0A7D5NCA2_9PROT|nr:MULTISPECIES: hypothetical protein [Candidatus Accumulibacter]MBL8400188.1 hypothetical protein [Accumulibacter sp.]MCC2867769.1 hypothetical protein [Candidatus Accumulibacter phosphatis]MCM8579690.1 hypothetical protein [Accumulibacter sp.]MCM8623884.1 hypothetical protein [Accumulibacter sp.]MCQ1548269.1 hypothetical protein [Candidatus Accumulibacter phosphatis]